MALVRWLTCPPPIPRACVQFERACEMCHITCNKNSVLGDTSAYTPGGVRIGTPAMTSRGLVEADFEAVRLGGG